MPKYILGIDLGTTSVKVSVVNIDTNEIEDHFTEATDCETQSIQGAHEQYVPKIVSTLNTCLEKIKNNFREGITKIGVCGQMHGVLFWKVENGEKPWKFESNVFRIDETKVSKLYTWQDARCDEKFLATLPPPDSHLGISTGFGIPTIFWLKRKSPKLLEEYNRSGLMSSFVVAMLCDQEQVYTSYQNAASWGYFNCKCSQWNMDLLKKFDFPVGILPELRPGGVIAGHLKNNWYGVPAGIPVGVDLGDLQCSVISTIDSLHDAVINFSTSAQVAFVVSNYNPPDGPPKVTPVSYWPYFSNLYVAVAASLNGGNVLVLFVNLIESWFADLGVKLDKQKVWEELIRLAGEVSGEASLVVKPTCFGERFEPDLTASVTNINGQNLTLGEVFKALCTGLILNLHRQLPSETLKESKCNRIVGNGQGLYKNSVLRSEVERIYQLPLVFTKVGDASKGAAMAVHKYGDVLDVSCCRGKHSDPQPSHVGGIPSDSPRCSIITRPCQCPGYCKCGTRRYSLEYASLLNDKP